MDGFRTCGPFGKPLSHIDHMPTIDRSDEEYGAVMAALRQAVDRDRYSQLPRLRPFKTALATLDPASVPKVRVERPPPEAPARARGGRRTRR
jgi:hypothetical protein